MKYKKIKVLLTLSLIGILTLLCAFMADAKGLSKSQKKLVKNPEEVYVCECLGRVEKIMEIEAATEENDPNGKLHKKGGYTSAVYFTVEGVDQSSLSGSSPVDKGTEGGGQIEVYKTRKDAKKRDAYLAQFDGTLFSSGSHTVVGTVIVRLSDKLTATAQQELEKRIIEELTRVPENEKREEREERSRSIEILSGDLGEYGQIQTLNAQASPETYECYFVPKGRYTVTNLGKDPVRVSLYKNSIVKSHGREFWEEGEFFMLGAGESRSFKVKKGYFIEPGEEGHLLLERSLGL